MTVGTRRVYVAPDGVRLVADVAGGSAGAPTVVMLHGGGQTRHSWARTAEVLANSGYNVINYDARGHGDSTWSPDGRYTFADRAEDLRTVLSDIHGPFALVGASMGGLTCLEALGRGIVPAALVLVDIVLRPERRGVDRIRKFMTSHPDGFASLAEAAEAVAAYNPQRARPASPGGLMQNLRIRPDGRLRWHWDPAILSGSVDTHLTDIGQIIDRLSNAPEVPVLLIRGQQSDVLNDENVADFCRQMKDVEVLTIAGAGHMVAGDNNSVFAAGVMDFLQERLPARG